MWPSISILSSRSGFPSSLVAPILVSSSFLMISSFFKGNNFMKSYGLFPLSSGFSSDYSDSFDPRYNRNCIATSRKSY